MEQELATDATTEVAATPQPSPPPASTLQEKWSDNEPMRHIPSVDWIANKLDRDVRARLEVLASVVETLAIADPRHVSLAESLRKACVALDHLAEASRHSRSATPPSEIANRIGWSLNNAISSVRTMDATTFGRRYPFQTLDRSKAECVYAALLVVLDRIDRVVPLVRDVDPSVDERLLQGLVNLETPMPQQRMA